MISAAARELAIVLANRKAGTVAGRPATAAQQAQRDKRITELRHEIAAVNQGKTA